MKRIVSKCVLLLLPLSLLAASCGYRASPSEVTLATGETATAHVVFVNYGVERPAMCFSSDSSVMTVSQAPNDATVTIQALHPGVAYIRPVDAPAIRVATVTVFECPPVTIQPNVSLVETRVGQPVLLSVATAGAQPLKTVWLLENPPGSWMIVNGNGKSFPYTPAASGTYHFRVEYNDR
jgi:hypothetical protein